MAKAEMIEEKIEAANVRLEGWLQRVLAVQQILIPVEKEAEGNHLSSQIMWLPDDLEAEGLAVQVQPIDDFHLRDGHYSGGMRAELDKRLFVPKWYSQDRPFYGKTLRAELFSTVPVPKFDSTQGFVGLRLMCLEENPANHVGGITGVELEDYTIPNVAIKVVDASGLPTYGYNK